MAPSILFSYACYLFVKIYLTFIDSFPYITELKTVTFNMLRTISRVVLVARQNVSRNFEISTQKLHHFVRIFQIQASWSRSFGSKTTDNGSDIVHLEDNPQIQIPLYPVRLNEPLETRRQR